MYLNNDKLIGLPVFTQSEQNLGRVDGFEIDSSTHTVSKYFVKSSGLIEGLFKDKLLVDKSQVVSLDKEKMVVEDNIIAEGAKEFKTATAIGQQ